MQSTTDLLYQYACDGNVSKVEEIIQNALSQSISAYTSEYTIRSYYISAIHGFEQFGCFKDQNRFLNLLACFKNDNISHGFCALAIENQKIKVNIPINAILAKKNKIRNRMQQFNITLGLNAFDESSKIWLSQGKSLASPKAEFYLPMDMILYIATFVTKVPDRAITAFAEVTNYLMVMNWLKRAIAKLSPEELGYYYDQTAKANTLLPLLRNITNKQALFKFFNQQRDNEIPSPAVQATFDYFQHKLTR